jgi:hypothetical protein
MIDIYCIFTILKTIISIDFYINIWKIIFILAVLIMNHARIINMQLKIVYVQFFL